MGFSLHTTFGANGQTGSTAITSSPFDVTAGDLLIAAGRAGGLASYTINDLAGNTWTPIDSVTTADQAQWWFAVAAASFTGNTVTIGFGAAGPTFRAVVGAVYSGPHATPLDQHVTRAYTSSTSSLQTSSPLTVTYADELVIGIGAPAALGDTYTPSGLVDTNRRVEDFLVLCDKIHTGTPAAANVTIGLSASAGSALFLAATFRPAATGGGPQTLTAGVASSAWSAPAPTTTPGAATIATGTPTASWATPTPTLVASRVLATVSASSGWVVPAATIATASAVPYKDRVLADGASAYWQLEEPPGSGLAADVTGNVPYTSIYPGVVFEDPGVIGKAIRFTGTGHLAAAAGGSYNQFGTGPATLECWFKTTTTPPSAWHNLIDGQAGGNRGLLMRLWANGLRGEFNTAAGVSATVVAGPFASIADGQWHHAAVVLTRGTPDALTIYLDGVQRATTTIGTSGLDISNPGIGIGIGGQQDAPGGTLQENFVGTLDEVAIYPLALTPAQIVDHARGEGDLRPTAAVATWVVPAPTLAATVTIRPAAAAASWTVRPASVQGSASALATSAAVATWVVPPATMGGALEVGEAAYFSVDPVDRSFIVNPVDRWFEGTS